MQLVQETPDSVAVWTDCETCGAPCFVGTFPTRTEAQRYVAHGMRELGYLAHADCDECAYPPAPCGCGCGCTRPVRGSSICIPCERVHLGSALTDAAKAARGLA